MKSTTKAAAIGLGVGIGYLAIMILMFKTTDMFMDGHPDIAKDLNYARILNW